MIKLDMSDSEWKRKFDDALLGRRPMPTVEDFVQELTLSLLRPLIDETVAKIVAEQKTPFGIKKGGPK